MKTHLVPLLTLLALGACVSAPSAPAPAQVAGQGEEVTPCKTHTGDDAPDRTRDFGRCLALADSVASQVKPTAQSPDATHWGLPQMQGYIDSTAQPIAAREDD